MTAASSLRFMTDFEQIEDGSVLALPGFGGSVRLPEADADVELFDSEGNTCQGIVLRVNGEGLIYVRPDWNTWRAPASVGVLGMVDTLLAAVQQVTAARDQDSEDASAGISVVA